MWSKWPVCGSLYTPVARFFLFYLLNVSRRISQIIIRCIVLYRVYKWIFSVQRRPCSRPNNHNNFQLLNRIVFYSSLWMRITTTYLVFAPSNRSQLHILYTHIFTASYPHNGRTGVNLCAFFAALKIQNANNCTNKFKSPTYIWLYLQYGFWTVFCGSLSRLSKLFSSSATAFNIHHVISHTRKDYSDTVCELIFSFDRVNFLPFHTHRKSAVTPHSTQHTLGSAVEKKSCMTKALLLPKSSFFSISLTLTVSLSPSLKPRV